VLARSLFLSSFAAYGATALPWWFWSSFIQSPLREPGDVAGALLFLPFLVFYYPFSFVAAYEAMFGERFVSHGIVASFPASKELLLAAIALLTLGLAARRFPSGRLLACVSMGAFTFGGAIDWWVMVAHG